MSLRNTLLQSVAALDRIAPSRRESSSSLYFDDEKIPIDKARPLRQWRDDEKFIRLSTSTLSLPHLRRSKSLPSVRHPPLSQAEEDWSKMEIHGEPKITLRYAAQVMRHLLTIAFSFISMGMAVAIIGLAADNINWGTGRGSEDANTVTAVVLGKYDAKRDYVDRWVTKMNWVPDAYKTPTFAGLIVAASVCVLGGCIAAPLSILFWRSAGQSVELGRRQVWPQHWTLLICLVLESIQFLTTLVVLICVRELYSQETGYNPYDLRDAYSIVPQYFDPPLPPPPPPNATYSWEPMDDVFRYYHSPMRYNPLNWNCRLQGHVTSSKQHRLFQLCEEGNAARWLLVSMLLLQGIVLASHTFAWSEHKRSRNLSWAQHRLRSEDDARERETE